ncbi:MAG: HDOD domain-containing protein [Gammaproteobacteria bacterium]|nr:HDOD domain-containing protein [Gammaproteobacteria bacterium]
MTIESIELVRLPSPPHLLSRLLDVCHDPDSTIDELADLIGTDAALTGKLIMAVNSAAFEIKQPIENLSHAVALLGHELVKTMMLTSSMQQLFAGLINTQKEFVCNAWLESLYCAVISKDFAHSLNYDNPQDAYLAGLLHHFGQIVFDAKFHDQYVDIMNSPTEAEVISKEIKKFGTSHTELGACLIEQWASLSPAIADAVRFHHEEEELLQGGDILCQIVAEASEMSRHLSRFGRPDTNWQSALVDEKELKLIYIHVQDKLSQVAASFGIPYPKSGSLTQVQFSQDIERETIRLARKIRDASLVKVITSEDIDSTNINTPKNLLLKIAREMQLLFSISDVAMLFPDSQNRSQLALYEVNQVRAVSKFSIENSKSQIIRSYLEKRNIWIEPEKALDEISPISDRQIIRRLNHEIAFCLPLGHGDQVIGAIVVGSNKDQKKSLENLAGFISDYLKINAELWLKNNQELKQRAFEDSVKKEQEHKDVDKLIHEISNPLSVIANYIDIIQGNSKSNDASNDEEIQILKEEVQRIGSIVVNFKEEKESEPATVLLNEELKMSVPLYVKSISNGKKVEIKWALDESDSEIEITRDALRQVILNLVKNGVEAQTRDAEILVSSRHFVNIDGATYAQFSIADRGRGIDPITRQLLFAPLASAKDGAIRGLGLSVTADIVARYNGQIKYMENEVGGSSFEILIPLRSKR